MRDALGPGFDDDAASRRELSHTLTVAWGHQQLLQRQIERGTVAVDERAYRSLVAIEHALRDAINAFRALQDR